MKELTWVEVSKEALRHNIGEFRKIVGKDVILCPCVKANAYGHGLIETGKVFLESGADWLAVNSLYEAVSLREAKVSSPIYVLGYVPLADLAMVCELDLRIVVYDKETVEELGKIGKPVKIHLKIETGNNRQGILMDDLLDFAGFVSEFSNIEIEGVATHFANVEDTTDHSYAEKQLEKFNTAIERLEDAGFKIKLKHCANSAATILFRETHFNMVRPGIAAYGMWPSKETYISYLKDGGEGFKLMPAFTWKTRIAQIKTVAAGEYIGYGCTYKTGSEARLAILPIGYYDGYDRCVHGAYVLIRGKRAYVRGRVCMNIIMVDVSDIDGVELEDEVVLIGRDGEEFISAEDFGNFAGTINYEVTTRVNDRIKRIYN
ncbi:alanine racemase [Candidatus Peregrinibacteria bacterium CG10_big_fil_rev_8_21_14_0_10_36_19]|nr:MAG: alanine racemase [Candidatus Peregrinibacteria bacterium CG10_big_fil_rev_8_21_14_0_10_36_19]